jgi:hypothetical protein
MPSVIMPSVIMPSVIMPSVIMPSVIMPSVTFYYCHAECHFLNGINQIVILLKVEESSKAQKWR